MKCPSCGADNPEGNRFCYKCGIDMTSVPEPEPTVGEPEVKGPVCPKCGTENTVGHGYCFKCGAKLEPTPEPKVEDTVEEETRVREGSVPKPPKPKDPKKGGKGWIAVVVAILAVAVVAIAAFAMTGDDPAPERPLDHIQTPNGTYVYDAVVTVNGQVSETTLQYTIRNGEITSYRFGDHTFTSSELKELKEEMEDREKYSYGYVEGPYWHNDSTECKTYKVTYDNFDVIQVISEDGRILYESVREDGVETRITLEGWMEGRLTHTVTFLNEDGTTYLTQTVFHGGEFTFPQLEAREHYTFLGWVQEDSGVFYRGNYILAPVNSDLVFKASWDWETYTITFDANGGVNTHSQRYWYTFKYTLPDETLITRTGYKLLGWSDSPDATTETYSCSQKMTATEDRTFYAVWKDMSDVTHHVTYYGGVGWPYTMNEVDVKHGTILSNTDFLYGKDGYSFVCWTYNGKDIGSDTPVLSDMTLVGRWHKLSDMTQSGKTVTITLADKGVQHTIAWGDGSFSYVTDSASHTYTEDRFMTNIVVYQKDEATGNEYACQHSVYTKDFLNVSLALKCEGPLNQYTKESTWYLDGIDEDVDWYVNFTYMGRSDSVDVKLESPGIYWIMAVYSDGSDLRGLVSLNKLFEIQ